MPKDHDKPLGSSMTEDRSKKTIHKMFKGFASMCYDAIERKSKPMWVMDAELHHPDVIQKIRTYTTQRNEANEMPVMVLRTEGESVKGYMDALGVDQEKIVRACADYPTALMSYSIKNLRETYSLAEAQNTAKLIQHIAQYMIKPTKEGVHKPISEAYRRISTYWRRHLDHKKHGKRLMQLPTCDQWLQRSVMTAPQIALLSKDKIQKIRETEAFANDPETLNPQDTITHLRWFADGEDMAGNFLCCGGIKHAALVFSYWRLVRTLSSNQRDVVDDWLLASVKRYPH